MRIYYHLTSPATKNIPNISSSAYSNPQLSHVTFKAWPCSVVRLQGGKLTTQGHQAVNPEAMVGPVID